MFVEWDELNVIAIILGTLLYMVYGGIYYSVRIGGDKYPEKKQLEMAGPMKYIVSVIVALISSFLVAVLVQATGAESITSGLLVGLMIGVIITLVYLKNRLFGLMTHRSFLIAVGDHLAIFTLLGALHGLM